MHLALYGACSLFLFSVVQLWGQSVLSILFGSAFALGMGALFGLTLYLVFFGLSHLSASIARFAWLGLGAIPAHYLYEQLNLERISRTANEKLYFIAILGCLALWLFVSLTGLLLQPTKNGPLLGKNRGYVFAVLLIAGTIAALYVDSNYLQDLYPAAHLLLKIMAIFATIIAIFLLLGAIYVPKWSILVVVPLLMSANWAFQNKNDVLLGNVSCSIPNSIINIARSLTDFDFDGSSSLFGGGDCEPFNPHVSPLVKEIPNNGIDDNCKRGDLNAPPSLIIPPEETEPHNVSFVLITVDSLRPDHMSVYGYSRDTTPNLRKWAENSRIYRNAYTSGTGTSIAIPTLMTGQWARKLKWTEYFEGEEFKLLTAEQWKSKGKRNTAGLIPFFISLDDLHPLLSERFVASGYYTVAVVHDSLAQFFDERFGFSRGFNHYAHLEKYRQFEQDDKGTTDLALSMLEKRPQKPFFLWVHYFGVHSPNEEHQNVENFGSSIKDAYDHEILYWDQEVARLLTKLDEIAQREKLYIAITGDHGESIEDYIRLHGTVLDDEQSHVPLILKGPNIKPGIDDRLVGHVDVVPTFLACAGLNKPRELPGFDLLGEIPSDRLLFIDAWRGSFLNKSGVRSKSQLLTYDFINNVWSPNDLYENSDSTLVDALLDYLEQ